MSASELPEERVKSHLGLGERLLWTGRPQQGLLLGIEDAPGLVFGFIFIGFCVSWATVPIWMGTWWLILGTIPWAMFSICAGFFIIFSSYFLDTKFREGGLYAVTSERVIMYSGAGAWRRLMYDSPDTWRINSIPFSRMADVCLNQEPDGSGEIVFGIWDYTVRLKWDYRRRWEPSFRLTSDTRQVYQIIQSARRAATRSG